MAKLFTLGSFADPNAGATSWTVAINWGDSTSSSQTLASQGSLGSLLHTYTTLGVHTVTIKVTDNLGVTGTGSFTVMVGM